MARTAQGAIVAVVLGVLAGCSESAPSGATRPPLPPFEADCAEIEAAIDFYGEERIFRHHIDDLLTGNGLTPEDASADQSTSAVLAVRDIWSLCAFDVPQFAEDQAADSPLAVESVRAQVARDTLRDQGIHAFDEATDAGINGLGKGLCTIARPLQPLSTSEIQRIGADIADRFGRLTTLYGAKVFFITAGLYCPNLDMSG